MERSITPGAVLEEEIAGLLTGGIGDLERLSEAGLFGSRPVREPALDLEDEARSAAPAGRGLLL